MRTVLAILELSKVLNFNYTPVPYNVSYTLNIFTATAENGLIEIRGILTLMREIAEQSVTESVTDVGRVENDMEFRALGSEITRIASQTERNGIYILDGSFTDNTLRIGFDADVN